MIWVLIGISFTSHYCMQWVSIRNETMPTRVQAMPNGHQHGGEMEFSKKRHMSEWSFSSIMFISLYLTMA